jgi:LCP family protein required for cell wall assembly
MAIKTRIVHNRSGVQIVDSEEYRKGRDKLVITKNKKKSKDSKVGRTMRLINFSFIFLALFIFLLNGFFIYQYRVHGYTPTQAFSGVAQNSIQVIDTVWEPELKSTNGYTAALIMGIDSRELQFDGEEFAGRDRDIDTIMQVVVNNESGDIFIISIPRDTGVTITEECANQARNFHKSINHAYKLAEDGSCPGGGPEMMQKYVTSITGFENHYYAIISYDAFRDIVDAIGDEEGGKKGLYIDVPRNIQEYYPREQGGGFEAVYFPQGRQFIDSTDLLKYARSRKASSDFDRAKRQQQVVEAIQQKAMSSETLSDPIKLYNLYNSFQKNALFSELSIEDIRGGLSLAEKMDSDRIYKLVLDDNFGGLNSLMTRPSYSGKGMHNRPGYYLSPVAYNDPECLAADDEYCKVKQYLFNIYQSPDILAENSTIYAYANVRGAEVTNSAFERGKSNLQIPVSTSRWSLPGRSGWGEVQIYDFSNGEKPKTKAALEEAFAVDIKPGSAAAFPEAINGEDFAIIVKVN